MSESDQSGAGRREVAYRIFASEFEQADFSYSESDEERAPSYVITPTGARANRLFFVGVLTEVEQVSDDVLRGRVVDPTGAFVLYAGQYQPDEQAFLDRAEPPTFVAVTGKARTFQPEDSDQIFTSVRPESISEVDIETRDKWTVQAAEHTHRRIRWMAEALSFDDDEPIRQTLLEAGADDGLAHGIELALSHYHPTPTYLHAVHETALEAAQIVSGQKDEIASTTYEPAYEGTVSLSDLLAAVGSDATPADSAGTTADSSGSTSVPESTAKTSTATDGSVGSDTPAKAGSDSQSDASDTSALDPADEEPTTDDSVDSPGENVTAKDSKIDGTDGSARHESAEIETRPSGSDSDLEDSGSVETDDEIGDFTTESSERADDVDTGSDEEVGDFDPEEFELEAETREQIEQEYGTEFQSGTEVDDPGEAGIETPDPVSQGDEESSESPDEKRESVDPDDSGSEATDTSPATESEPPSAEATSTESVPGQTATAEATTEDTATAEATTEDTATETDTEEPADLQAAVVKLMGELDAGDGADRDDLIAEMDARYGTDREAVEDAIEDALMAGECYEPDETLLKPI